jgi:hypothetical protein
LEFGYLRSLHVEDLYASVANKIHKLQSLVTPLTPTLALLVPQVHTKDLHLRGRLLHLTVAGLSSSNIEASCMQQLHEQLMVSVGKDERLSQEQTTLMPMGNRAQGPAGDYSIPQAGKTGGIQNIEEVSTVLASVSNPMLTGQMHVVQEAAEVR